MKKSELRKIIRESIKSILKEDWWSDLGPDGQEAYIKQHPNSQKAKEAKKKEISNTRKDKVTNTPTKYEKSLRNINKISQLPGKYEPKNEYHTMDIIDYDFSSTTEDLPEPLQYLPAKSQQRILYALAKLSDYADNPSYGSFGMASSRPQKYYNGVNSVEKYIKKELTKYNIPYESDDIIADDTISFTS